MAEVRPAGLAPRAGTVELEQLHETLEGYNAHDIGAILGRLSPDTGAHWKKSEQIAVLARLLADPAVALRHVGTLSPLGRRLLGVVRRQGRSSIAALQLAGQDEEHDLAAVQRTLVTLLGLGLLLVEHRSGPQARISLDLDQPEAPFMWVSLLPALARAPSAAEESPPAPRALSVAPATVLPGEFALLRRDLYLILRFLRAAGLRLTRTGDPHKNDLRKLFAALRPGQATSKREVLTPQAEVRLSFLLRLLSAAGLIVARDGQMRAAEGAEALLNLPEGDAARRLLDVWLDLDWNEFERLGHLVMESWSYAGVGDLPTATRLSGARRTIVEALTRAPRGWLSLVALSDWLRQSAPEFLIARAPDPTLTSLYSYGGPFDSYSSYGGYYGARQLAEQHYYRGFARADQRVRDRRLRKDADWHEVEGAFVAEVVAEPLCWLGLVDVGFAPARPRQEQARPAAVRLTALGERLLHSENEGEHPPVAGMRLIVQPNFEILVLDALAHFDLIGWLDDFAEAQSLDRAAIYHLTRASVVRGLAAGWTEARIVSTLEAAGATLPLNVRQTLTDWARDYERIHVHRAATLLEAPDAATLDRWLDDGAIGATARRLSATVALVESPGERVGDALTGRGVVVRQTDYALDPPRILDLPDPGALVWDVEDDDPYLRYQVRRFADPQEGHQLSGARRIVYAITPDSLGRARAQGMTIDAILAFLKYKTRTGLTADDALTLRGWSGYYAPFRYAAVRLVELPPSASWGDLLRSKAIRPLVLRALSASQALVPEENWPQLVAVLTERGISVQPGLSDAASGEATRRRVAALGMQSAADLVGRPATAKPARGRGRHRATLQHPGGRQLLDLLETAIDNEQSLVIEYRKQGERRGALRTIDPLELEFSGGSYYLQAYCYSRQDERRFRVSNITGVALADKV